MPQEERNKENYGLDNICILRTDLKMKKNEVLDGVDFTFHFGKYDNVICESQSLKVDFKADKIHVIGFAYWGNVNEAFVIVYEDMSTETIRIPFVDWSRKINNSYQERTWAAYGVTTPKTFITSGALTHLAYFHHNTYELKNNKVIKEIRLPDNMFVHIFAITLETKENLK